MSSDSADLRSVTNFGLSASANRLVCPQLLRRHAAVHHLPVVRHARWSNHVVVHIDIQLAVFDQQTRNAVTLRE